MIHCPGPKRCLFQSASGPKSQQYFAFELHGPEIRISGQLTPPGFKSSPTIFDEALHEDLGEYQAQNPDRSLLQCVDDLLIAVSDQETCLTGTEWLLQTLGDLGYCASVKKAQICKQQVTYLGYILKEGNSGSQTHGMRQYFRYQHYYCQAGERVLRL